jgi:hypothetical protein
MESAPPDGWTLVALGDGPSGRREVTTQPQPAGSDLRAENQFIAAGIGQDVMDKFVQPYNQIQGEFRDFYASKGFQFGSPRLQAEYADRFKADPNLSEAQIHASMNEGERAWHQSKFDQRSDLIRNYLDYKNDNPIPESEKNAAEMLPGSNDRQLTSADVEKCLQGFTPAQKADALELMQKEIEAKSGRLFAMAQGKDAFGWPDLDNYFSHKTWYQATYDDTHAHLNDAAKANMGLLVKMERDYRGLK